MHMVGSYAGEDCYSACSAHAQRVGCWLSRCIGVGMLIVCMKLKVDAILIRSSPRRKGKTGMSENRPSHKAVLYDYLSGSPRLAVKPMIQVIILLHDTSSATTRRYEFHTVESVSPGPQPLYYP